MKNVLKLLVLSLFWFACPVSGYSQNEIIETKEIADLLNHAAKDSIVFFNITGTLYKPSNTLSEHAWRIYFGDKTSKLISDPERAEKLTNKIKNMIVSNIPKALVEPVTAKLINDLQKNKIPALGITKKSLANDYADNFGEITYRHLQSLGIDLELTLDYLLYTPKAQETRYAFRYGILFTQKKAEGPALAAFIESLKIKPKKIVMVDNSLSALKSAGQSMNELGIDFVGFRYGRCDDKLKNFDTDLGTIQLLEYLQSGKILTDQEASKIKQQNPHIKYEQLLENFILSDA